AEYLQLWLDGRPVPIHTPGVGELLRRWMREHRPLVGSIAAATLAILLTVVIAFVLVTRSRDEAINLAIDQTRLADDNAGLATKNGQLAAREKEARGEVEKALAQETRARRKADWLAYAALITLAQNAWRQGNVDLAWNYLNSCRPDLRGWEYEYLYTL